MLYWGDMSFILLIPAMIFAIYAQGKVKTTFDRYLRVRNSRGYTGMQVARRILDSQGLYDVPIELTGGHLSDHYDPRKKVLRLSNAVYNGSSVASVGVAAHEVGHAIQHAKGYAPLMIRNFIAPIASFGSQAAWFLFVIGLMFPATGMMDIGILFFLVAVLFQIITLPVEFNASNRAIGLLENQGLLSSGELVPTKKVLQAAALTYVAATVVALSQLLRLLMIRGRRD
ncbi:zinc metallopeptidase [Irregularibacter muris]|uniref:Zinc metallopeptidase n=1 Tax=Irregularibacter muris TaxID=1796619 RepID=A0AAE3KYT9_9FIRM|nr:zinc metallopeptidase [Irregularibacter muris]MCR1898170.1 zinc metallopeptidase [Irregularibacter muris]